MQAHGFHLRQEDEMDIMEATTIFFITMSYHQTEADQQGGLAEQLPRVPIYKEPSLEIDIDGKNCPEPSHERVIVFLKPCIIPE